MPNSEKSELMIFNQEIKLSFDDYKLHIDPVLSEFHDDIYEYNSIFLNLEEKESNSKKEIYFLFRFICFFIFIPNNQEYPFQPEIESPGKYSGTPNDIPINHQTFLQQIVEKITNPLIQARVSDVLWVIQKENKKSNAEVALNAYMILIERNFKDLAPLIIQYIQRALFLSGWIRSKVIHRKTIKKFEDLLQKNKLISDPYIGDVILLLIKEKEVNKDLLIQIFEDKVKSSNNLYGPQDLEGLQDLEKIYNSVGKLKEASECKIHQGEIYAQRGDLVERPSDKRAYYNKSLEVYPEMQKTKSRIKEINTKLSAAANEINTELLSAANDSFKEIELTEISLLEEDISNFIQEKYTKEVEEKVTGLGFLEALELLISYIRLPSIKKLEEEVNMERHVLGLLSPIIADRHIISTINSQSRFESQHSDIFEEVLAFYFTQRYFLCMKPSILYPIRKGLETIRKEHNNIKEDDWSAIINKSSLIPRERLQSFSVGFYHWFCEKNFIALPILIPQFENSIRYLIQNSGNDTSVHRNKEKKQEEESFKKNLSHVVIKNRLGEDLALHLKILLITKNGFNLRNKIGHGLVDDSFFSNLECDYFVLLVLTLILETSN